MEPKQITIGLYAGYWDREDDMQPLENALVSKFGKAKDFADKAGCLYFQFEHRTGELDLKVDLKTAFQFTQYNENNYDLIFLFSRCVGVNPQYQVGDLVIVDPASAHHNFLKPHLEEISKTLPEIKSEGMDTHQAESQIIKSLSESEKLKPRDIFPRIGCTLDDWQTVVLDVLMNGKGRYWDEDGNKYFLNDAGKKLKAEGTPSVTYPRQPSIKLGSSHCTFSTITSRADIAGHLDPDVIDQISQHVLNKRMATRDMQMPILDVCAVKCLVNQDVAATSAFTNSIAASFVDFVLQATRVYQDQLLHNIEGSLAKLQLSESADVSQVDANGIPYKFMCPITQELMVDPYKGSDGYSYEKQFIESWVRETGTSPITGAWMTLEDLHPNEALKKEIEQWQKSKK